MLKFLLLASFAAAASANSVFGDFVMHEQREDAPNGFVMLGTAPTDQVLNLRLALVNSDMAGLEDALYAVSNPDSVLYGQHLTKEEVEEFVKPNPESLSIVHDFLASHRVNATSISPAGDWLALSVPVSKANEMFDTEFSVFQHQATGKTSVRTLAYSIPAALKGHLNLVHPTITFDKPLTHRPVVSAPLTRAATSAQKLAAHQSVPPSCDVIVTPECLQALYDIPTAPATQSSNKLAVSGFIEQYANKQDLKTFLRALRPDISSNTTFKLHTLDGGSNSQNLSEAGIEASLDIQYTIGLASGVPTTFISVGEDFHDGPFEGFLDIVIYLLGEKNPPHVMTTSYGFNEADFSRELAIQLCNAYMQLGARGVSILFSSGDGGVSGSQPGSCSTFLPTFPSVCPYVTSVGATAGVSETAAFFSGGGFSKYFSTAPYQARDVNEYLNALGSTNDGLFNRKGRAYPDVAAQGENVAIVVGGKLTLVGGTSCSSPIFASIISLINDRLIAAGKPVLGFLNPFLYSPKGRAALNDITIGNNPGCNTTGFPARAGWDPVTGLGTPNFDKLLSAVGLDESGLGVSDILRVVFGAFLDI